MRTSSAILVAVVAFQAAAIPQKGAPAPAGAQVGLGNRVRGPSDGQPESMETGSAMVSLQAWGTTRKGPSWMGTAKLPVWIVSGVQVKVRVPGW